MFAWSGARHHIHDAAMAVGIGTTIWHMIDDECLAAAWHIGPWEAVAKIAHDGDSIEFHAIHIVSRYEIGDVLQSSDPDLMEKLKELLNECILDVAPIR